MPNQATSAKPRPRRRLIVLGLIALSLWVVGIVLFLLTSHVPLFSTPTPMALPTATAAPTSAPCTPNSNSALCRPHCHTWWCSGGNVSAVAVAGYRRCWRIYGKHDLNCRRHSSHRPILRVCWAFHATALAETVPGNLSLGFTIINACAEARLGAVSTGHMSNARIQE